jgi:flagellar motility protein MotE (MotC chaperone)
MPILLGVIQHMKPAHTAPIMAKMAPEKAKDVTIALTKQDQLPQVK